MNTHITSKYKTSAISTPSNNDDITIKCEKLELRGGQHQNIKIKQEKINPLSAKAGKLYVLFPPLSSTALKDLNDFG